MAAVELQKREENGKNAQNLVAEWACALREPRCSSTQASVVCV